MNVSLNWLGVIAVVAGVAHSPSHRHATGGSRAGSLPPCATDSNYQRLAFWVGDWEVVDSTGADYATQRVRPVVDGCAFTAEWTGRVGNKGLNVSSFDERTGEWRQVYVSNQVPAPSGVAIRRSDPTYRGPGIRFIPLLDPPAGELALSRVTIMPLADHRALQLFEDSNDGGKTWHVIFKAEHRPRKAER